MDRQTLILVASILISVVFITGLVFIALLYKTRNNQNSSKSALYDYDDKQLFLEFTQNIQQVLWRLSTETNEFTFISRYAEQVFAQPLDLIDKKIETWLRFVVPEDQPKVMHALKRMKENPANNTLQIKILRADGIMAVLSLQLFPSLDAQGKIIAILGITSDVTTQFNAALQKRLRADLHKNLNKSNDLNSFTYSTLQSIGLAVGYDMGELWIFDEKENSLACIVSWFGEKLKNSVEHHQQFIISPQTQHEFPVICLNNNIIQYSTHKTHLKPMGANWDEKTVKLKEVVGIPIEVADKRIGVLCFYNQQILNLDVDGYRLLLDFAKEFGEYIQNKLLTKQLKYISDYDVLTGLHNHVSIEKKIKEMIANGTQSITVIKLRVNNFQLINFAFGYDVGNKILQEMSKKIVDFSTNFSNSLSYIDMIALIESGAFCFLSSQFRDKKMITDFVGVLLNLFKQPFKKNDIELFLSANVGISRYPQNGTTSEQLLGSAVMALLESSNEGSNRFKFATKDSFKKTSEHLEIENAIHHALENNELELYYQPKVSLKTGAIVGVEGLIRWHDPRNSMRTPEYFISVCEQSDLIFKVNEWVMATAIRDIARSEQPIRTSINLSARQFSTSYNLLEQLNQLSAQYGVDYQYLEMEVTETLLMTNRLYASKVISELRKLGVTISLDDFGTGYSSFAYLMNFAPDVIKMDKSFIDGIPEDSKSNKIVNAMISVAHSLGLKVVAEGVENAAQVGFLKSADCDEIQGYYFSKPVPFAEVQMMIKNDLRLSYSE
ncbi:GGDEF domain-containing phosphodiesterase [Legionella worsleiensis]|uniref:Regulatory protein (GGDEF and EAL domains) n=1 Tax=Legionella worsleiensis TaxID=45076 RepID=A0A0W1AAK2_9GAMM|nr:GGDEF domain-containing phosphodiesterase [Legionella worsleiensis]KTD78292.1 regulatory protein (GGDEF and EAL domains) [Legionella worsleiensis]STY32629.1 regulatory protein (GGDEF and EAL domains) [Legionella worsleiensis]